MLNTKAITEIIIKIQISCLELDKYKHVGPSAPPITSEFVLILLLIIYIFKMNVPHIMTTAYDIYLVKVSIFFINFYPPSHTASSYCMKNIPTNHIRLLKIAINPLAKAAIITPITVPTTAPFI